MQYQAEKTERKPKKTEDQWWTYPLLCLIDLECTCSDDGTIPPDRMETIEIGAVLVRGDDFSVLDEFSTFVKPAKNQNLTEFCMSLTGIAQGDVDSGADFSSAFGAFVEFSRSRGTATFASWGAFDRLQLGRECKVSSIPFPFPEHLNLKAVFRKVTGIKHEVSLPRALEHAGLAFEGCPHRALTDAKNTARLLPYLSAKEYRS